jgi:chorismate mutase
MGKKIVIAGPCALESREQLRKCVKELMKADVKMIRASLWKPRTSPGWEGLCFMGLPVLLEETIPHGIIPATEIMTAYHAQMCIDALRIYNYNAKMLVWIGSRNQNHFEIQRMAKILSGSDQIILAFKNQMWMDEKHWYGLFQHITHAGFPVERLLTCHRGFSPGFADNPRSLRNLPDYEMCMRVKEKMKIPMLIDPSHIAGIKEKVIEIIKESNEYDFDGVLIEVHENAKEAKTDVGQQLSIDEFKGIMQLIQSGETTAVK